MDPSMNILYNIHSSISYVSSIHPFHQCPIYSPTYSSTPPHLKEVKERNMFDEWSIKALIVLEEEEVSESSVQQGRVCSCQFHQLQSLSPAVTAPPVSCTILLSPCRTCVCLHRHHVQTYSERIKKRLRNTYLCFITFPHKLHTCPWFPV